MEAINFFLYIWIVFLFFEETWGPDLQSIVEF